MSHPLSARVGLVSRSFILAASLVGILAIGGCSRQEQVPPASGTSLSLAVATGVSLAGDGPPSDLVEIGASAEDVFDAARASNWNDADHALQDMKQSANVLNMAELRPTDLAAQLNARIAELETNVKGHRRVPSMDSANSVTHIVADLSRHYQVEIPYEIGLLDYYGRQIVLGVAASDASALVQTTAEIRQTWNAVEPVVLQRGGADEARRFTDIVVQLEGARAPADFAAAVQEELTAVDPLEKIFRP